MRANPLSKKPLLLKIQFPISKGIRPGTAGLQTVMRNQGAKTGKKKVRS
jgi:hypothetical protein